MRGKTLPLLLKFDKNYFITNWNSGRSVISRPTTPGKLRCSKTQHQRELCYFVSSSVKCQPGEWISGILHLSCLTEFPWLQLFFPVIVIYSIIICPINRQVYFVFFCDLFSQQFPSLLKVVTFSPVTHLCSEGLFWITRAWSVSTVFPRMQGEHVSTVQVICRAPSLLVLDLLQRYFPLLSFQPTEAAGDIYILCHSLSENRFLLYSRWQWFLENDIGCCNFIFSLGQSCVNP